MSTWVYMCGHAKELVFPQQGGDNSQEMHEESDWLDKKNCRIAKSNEMRPKQKMFLSYYT